MNFSQRTQFAIDIAREVGNINKKHLNKPQDLSIELKGMNDFVTNADKEVEDYIISKLKTSFPTDSIIAEEGHSNDDGETLWIIDPIDGTVNFYFEFPMFCLSIAYKDTEGIAGGVVYNSVTDELFVAERGKGAFLNGRKISVNQIDDPSKSLVTFGFANRDKSLLDDYISIYKAVMPSVIDIRRTGSAAIDLCYVACGRFSAYFEPALKIWDLAAGCIILSEAGGKFTDRNGNKIDLEKEDHSMLATNGKVHDFFLKHTKQRY